MSGKRPKFFGVFTQIAAQQIQDSRISAFSPHESEPDSGPVGSEYDWVFEIHRRPFRTTLAVCRFQHGVNLVSCWCVLYALIQCNENVTSECVFAVTLGVVYAYAVLHMHTNDTKKAPAKTKKQGKKRASLGLPPEMAKAAAILGKKLFGNRTAYITHLLLNDMRAQGLNIEKILQLGSEEISRTKSEGDQESAAN